jgi:hypothetical protein
MDESGDLFYKCSICCSVTNQPLIITMEVFMAKKKSEPEVVQTVWDLESLVCQRCRYHGNKPFSYCAKNNKFVGRKQNVCDQFKAGRKH